MPHFPPRTELLAARLALIGLLVPVAGGRWGSYLSVPGTPVYVADVLCGLGIAGLVLARVRVSPGPYPFVRRRTPPVIIGGSVALMAIILFQVLINTSQSSTLVTRDAVPIIYLSLLPFFWRAAQLLGEPTVRRLVEIACLAHTAWFGLAVFRVLPPIALPSIADVAIFTTRGDFDLLIAALSVVVFASSRRSSPGLKFILVGIALASFFAGGSRAGLFAGALLILIGLAYNRPSGTGIDGKWVAAGAFAFAGLAPVASLLLDNPPTWMRALTRLLDFGSAEQATAANTWNARLMAWDRVWRYTAETPERLWIGSGLGQQPVLESGAVVFLSGDPAVRAAHNFLITWVAFFGISGIAIIGATLVAWTLWSIARARRARSFSALGAGLASSVIVAGLGGVLLESPFGYMSLILGLSIAGLDVAAPSVEYPPQGKRSQFAGAEARRHAS